MEIIEWKFLYTFIRYIQDRKHKECNGIKRIVQLHSQECNGTYSIALLGNGIFYSISRDHKQPIKRSEFNKVLYNTLYT